MAKQAIVTLTTDFGSSDPYVGAMKGMILQYCPHAKIIDITHHVPPHQIHCGSFVLASAAPYFPAGTLHVVVVDPGVGTDRGILVAQFGGQLFLFPDNGIITAVKETMPLEALISVRNKQYLPDEPPSATFHGRDIFAPLAGQILSGVEIGQLGPTPSKYKLLDLPGPQISDSEILGHIIYVDHFGNLVSNISEQDIRKHWPNPHELKIDCHGKPAGQLGGTYSHVAPGNSLGVFNSMGLLEVAINQGRAVEAFHAGLGAQIRIYQQKFLDA